MTVFKTKSLTDNLTDDDIRKKGIRSTSLLSFERAIEESLKLQGRDKTPIGYEVTEQGIIMIWD